MSSLSFREGVRNRNRDAFIRQLHEEAPLYKDESGFWVVSRFADVREVLLDHARFSSAAMGGGTFSLPLLTDDPPRHSSLRGLVSKAFTPGRIEAMRPEIEALAKDLVARIEPDREVDIVAELTTPLPVTVIARMLGIPESDRERFKRWSDAITGLMGGPLGPERAQNMIELRDYFLGALEARRRAPGNDLVSALARAEEAGVQLSADEVVGFSILLLVAGNETTTNLLGSLLHRLADEPERWAELRREPALLSPAIEEALRMHSPAQIIMRRARQSTELSGQAIAEGEMLMVYLGAANRDPARWNAPESFDLRRELEPHIAFGFGVHTCIGAPLARLEAKTAMSALLERFDRVEPGQERPRRLPSGVLFGFRSLPLVFHRLAGN
ncbi:MAG: cytochrome P450 [Polyangiales bacterium]